MPNWNDNTLIVKGEKSLLENFKKHYKTKDNWLDFEKIISTQKDQDKSKLKWDKLTDKEKSDRWKNDFDTFWFNDTGYKFCIKNWGTKWNPLCEEPNFYKDELCYGFETAWSPPEPIIKKLIEKHPYLDFTLTYEEWGMEFGGILQSEKGTITKEKCWEIDVECCPNCEYTNTKKRTDKKFKCGDCETEFTIEQAFKED